MADFTEIKVRVGNVSFIVKHSVEILELDEIQRLETFAPLEQHTLTYTELWDDLVVRGYDLEVCVQEMGKALREIYKLPKSLIS